MVDIKIPSYYRVVSLEGVFKNLGWVGSLGPVHGVYSIICGLGVEDDTTYVEIILVDGIKVFRGYVEGSDTETFMVEDGCFCRVKVTVVIWEEFLGENC